MNEYIMLFLGAILINNFVLSKSLGICPFLGVSKKLSTALGMGGAVIFVMTLAGFVTSLLYYHILVPYNLLFLDTILFIVVIASLVQIVEILLQKFSQALYASLGIYLPLITTNCAVLGAATLAVGEKYNVFKTTFFCFASACGFTLALIIFSTLRERLEFSNIPHCLKGTPISLITAGLLAMIFMGFAGLA